MSSAVSRPGSVFHWLAVLLLVLTCAFSTSLAHAQPADEAPSFDLDAARQQIDKVQNALDKDELPDDATLLSLREQALKIQSGAQATAESLGPQLASVAARLDELGAAPEGKEAPDVAAQRAQLEKNHSTLDGQVKLARLLAVESGQTAERISTLRRSQFQASLGERRPSILGGRFWDEFADGWPRDHERLTAFGAELWEGARAVPLAVVAGLLAIAAVLVGARLRFGSLLFQLTASRVPPGRLRRSFAALAQVLQSVLMPALLTWLALIAVSWSGDLSGETEQLLARIVAMAAFGGFVSGLAYALLSPYKTSWRLLPLPDDVAMGLRRYPPMLGAAVVLVWLVEQVAARVNVTLSATIAANAVAVLVLAGTMGWALHRAERLRRAIPPPEGDGGPPLRPLWLVTIVNLCWIALATGVISIAVGYVAFGGFVVKQLTWALVVLCTAYLLAVLVEDAFTTLLASPPAEAGGEGKSDADAPRGRDQLAVLLSGVCRVTIVMFALVLLLAPFGEGPLELAHRMGSLPQGITIGEIQLRPGAVLQGVMVLVIALVSVRLVKHWLEDRYLPTTALDPGMRISASTLFGYAGVVVAVALGMSALGVGLERVAWVASALSVGIGFGLQAVVQNFVSGLILLAERPVKVGDWVALGGVEGDIQRINVRATEIRMADRSTLIVPNSEFITKTVRNVTHSNPQGVVSIKLPVPLPVDAEQVRSLMLAALQANESVAQSPAPSVSLEGVDSAGNLLFSGTCYVNSPRLSYATRSAILFDMLKRMDEAGISLAKSSTTTLVMGGQNGADDAGDGGAPLPPLPRG